MLGVELWAASGRLRPGETQERINFTTRFVNGGRVAEAAAHSSFFAGDVPSGFLDFTVPQMDQVKVAIRLPLDRFFDLHCVCPSPERNPFARHPIIHHRRVGGATCLRIFEMGSFSGSLALAGRPSGKPGGGATLLHVF